MESQLVSAGGCDIEYRTLGSGEPLVMLHGAGGFRLDQRAFDGLAAHCTVIVPSMPGFDASTAGATQNVQDVADVMAAFIKRVAGGRAIVIGESFGGGVSSWLAIRHPEVVSRLVLAAPAGLRQAGGPALVGLSPREMAVVLYGESYSAPPPTPDEAERRNANRQNAARIGSARPGFDPELQRELSKVQAPTLVVWGTEDRMILPSQARYFVEAIPDARLVTIDGAPHVLSAAVPEAFLDAVLGFLSQTEATSSAVA